MQQKSYLEQILTELKYLNANISGLRAEIADAKTPRTTRPTRAKKGT